MQSKKFLVKNFTQFHEHIFLKVSYSVCTTAWKVSWSFFWSIFSCIRSEYRDLLRKSLYSVRIQENTVQKNLRIWILFTQCTRKDMNLIRFIKKCFRFYVLIILLICYFGDAHHLNRGANSGGIGWGLSCSFLEFEKSALIFGGKCPNCVHELNFSFKMLF